LKALEISEKLKVSLASDLNILLAYVFGSQARESSADLSDVDLAVLLKRGGFEETYKIQRDAAKVLMIPEDKVDVLELSKASIPLKYTVLKEGIKVLDRGEYEKTIMEDVVNFYPETHFLTIDSARELSGCKDPTSINIDLVNKRVALLKEELLFLKRISARPVKQVLRSDEGKRAFERSIEVSIEVMLDVCKHVVAAQGLGVAETYADYVKRLVENDKISSDLGGGLLRFVRWRNVLVHRYMEIDYEELYEEAHSLLDKTAPLFINWATELIAKRP